MAAASTSPQPGWDSPPPDDGDAAGIVRLALVAVVAGVVTGLLGAALRLLLQWANRMLLELLEWVQDLGGWRVLLPVVLTAAAAVLARMIVRWVPAAAGSGVQRVEAMMRLEDEPPNWRVIPAKFVGAALSLGSGMLLGREGPMVQMGAAVGGECGRAAGFKAADRRSLAAAMGGVGLGVAFSAPLGGMVFVFEELARAIRTRLVVAALAGSAAALAVAVPLIGSQPVFDVPPVPAAALWHLPAYVLMGAVIGLLGAQYNRLIIACMDLVESLRALAPEVRAGLVGALVGALGLASVMFIGGGELLTTEVIAIGLPLGTLGVVLLVRWVMSPLSYAVGVPGGLFAPMLALGALLGAGFAGLGNAVLPGPELPTAAFAIVGMSTLFTAVVRAPVTGVVLCVEMTATTSVIVPMLIGAATAMIVCTLLKSPPIYETLRLRYEGIHTRG